MAAASSSDDRNSDEFLKKVRESFKYNIRKNAQFEELWNRTWTLRSDYLAVQSTAARLFKEYPELLADFNALLPRGCDITRDLNKAMQLIKKVQTRFCNDMQPYYSFHRVFNEWRDKKKSMTELCEEEICVLFADHQDLIEDFMQFLPNSADILSKKRRREAAE